jgi:hypothetical protein
MKFNFHYCSSRTSACIRTVDKGAVSVSTGRAHIMREAVRDAEISNCPRDGRRIVRVQRNVRIASAA